MPIAAEATKNLTVDANWSARTDSSINALRGVNLPALANSYLYERSDGSQIGTAFTAALNGNTMFILEQGLKFSLVSATAVGGTIATTQAGTGSGTFNFSVQPFGGTMTMFANATPSSETVNAFFVEAWYSSGTELAASGTSGDGSLVLTRVLSQSPARNLSDGETGTVEVKMGVAVASASYGAGTMRFNVPALQWTVGNNNIFQGERNNTDNKGANFTDTWFTPWVSVQ